MENLHSLDASQAATLVIAVAAFALAIVSIVIARNANVCAKKAEEIANALPPHADGEEGTLPRTRGKVLYTLEKKDYLDLWNHFQDRAEGVKEAMFNSVTWSIGFATAIFGFITVTKIDPTDLSVTAPKAVIVASAIGLLLCAYSVILVWVSRKHIRSNWDQANVCKAGIAGLTEIVGAEKSRRWKLGPLALVWNQVLSVIIALAALFAALIYWTSAGGSL